MRNHQKKLAIRDLQRQRARQMQMVNERFNQSGNNFRKNHHRGK